MTSLGSVPNSVSKPVKIPLESLQLHFAVLSLGGSSTNVFAKTFLRIVYVWLFALKLKRNKLRFIDMRCWSVKHEGESQ